MPLKVDLPEHVIRTADRLARRMGCRFVPNKEPTLMSDLPELKYLDEAARAAGWENYRDVSVSVPSHKSVVAHAKTLQKLAELEAENAWRPIEEARKDGTVVDVWVGGEFPGRLANVSWREPTDSEWWAHGGDTIETPGATWHDGFGPLGKDSQPTHFRPLPSPPKGLDA